MKERELKQLIQQQSDKIKELETTFSDEKARLLLKLRGLENVEKDYEDEFNKCQEMGVELTRFKNEINKLNRIINFIQRGMEGNEQFERVINDLKGGIE